MIDRSRLRPAGALLGMGLMLVAASLVVFLVMNLLPGDPAQVMLGTDATPDAVATLRHQMGLDRPLWLRYLGWMRGLLSLDLGTSLTYRVPVSQLLATRLQVTLPLAAASLLIALALGIPIGALAAARRGRAADTATMATAQLVKSVPDFWLGVMMILVFSLRLRWFPAGGFPGWDAGIWRAVAALVLPSLALALPNAALVARLMRSATITALQRDYIRTARARGLSRRAALWRHAVPNAMVPTVTLAGVQFPLLLVGTVLIENVFDLPGLGRLVLQAIDGRDLVVVQDIAVLLAVAVLLANGAVGLIVSRLDPVASAGRTAATS